MYSETKNVAMQLSKRTLYRACADLIFILHLTLVLVVLFGWAIPRLWPFYMTFLVITLISDVIFGYCILSKWEFTLRKKRDASVGYNYNWSTYYTHKLTQQHISDIFFTRLALVFLLISLGVNVYFHFFF
jgi:hypothetical protein